jgi:hypothetical protein
VKKIYGHMKILEKEKYIGTHESPKVLKEKKEMST